LFLSWLWPTVQKLFDPFELIIDLLDPYAVATLLFLDKVRCTQTLSFSHLPSVFTRASIA